MGKHRGEIKDDGAARGGRSTRGSQLAFALALTALMLGAFASFGGLAYAATQATNAAHSLKKVTTGHKVVVHNSSATGQYSPPKSKPGKKQLFTPPSGNSPGSGGVNTQQGGTLPFTGLSLGGTALASGLLLLLGMVLRRRERRAT